MKKELKIYIFIILSSGFLCFSFYYHIKLFVANFYLNQAESNLAQNDFSRAFEQYESALTAHSQTLDTYIRYRYGLAALSYGRISYYLGQKPEMKVLKRTIFLQEENREIWSHFTRNETVAGELSNLLFRLGENEYEEKAIDYFERALELSPKRPSIYLGMAETRMMAGKNKEAKEQINKALDLNPLNPQALWQFLLFKIKKEGWKNSEGLYRMLEESKDIELFDFWHLNELALACEEAGEKDQAIKFYQELLERFGHFKTYEEKIRSFPGRKIFH